MLREARSVDREAILEVVVTAGMFTPDDVDVVDDLLRDHLDAAGHDDHRCLVVEDDGSVTAVVYAEERPAADRVWELTMLGVRPERQGRGDGTALLGAIERDLSASGVRLLVVETSATAQYDSARRFYTARGYEQVATVQDYWADGDDLVVFRKRLTPST